MTSDREKTYAFYGELFGWTVVDPGPDYGGYVNFHQDGVPVAGCMQNMPEMQTPDVWSVYLCVADATATVDAAVADGGEVIVPAMPVHELGSMAVVTDAGGAVIGIWQPGLHKGIGLLDEPGTPSWFELHTRAYESAIAFYERVFGWKTYTVADTADFRYTTLGKDEDGLAGIMDATGLLPEGVPPHWSVYFKVDDTDAALGKVAELGGATVMAPEDTPYGRLAAASDLTGAMFKLVGPNRS